MLQFQKVFGVQFFCDNGTQRAVCVMGRVKCIKMPPMDELSHDHFKEADRFCISLIVQNCAEYVEKSAS